ncbi:thioredoxin family protein [Alisedimentitalea sp. MJ-SS2]|uniref:thioredoxin family protein n=1 Tax=Aliisedimentitalea sp. MJ-SS2 TaxID=3049795 RepID=UPI0029110890|nr:thioredoxin family protein [Alisedimentitalea sp. MJ-SS2]MDU8929076.1 thioredoxin family protein [Alisedimentitalea sp. MJ-SS2]
MLTRREVLASAAAVAVAGPIYAAGDATEGGVHVELGDDGLHKQPWFLDSFLEMGDDLQTAADQGRNLLVIWEQNGCPYCRELHYVNFQKKQIVEFIQQHFDVIQLDMFGSREVMDFDGETLEERRLADKWGVQFTPTTMAFHGDKAGAASVKEAEVFRMPGYLRPFHYLSSLEYVVAKDYENQGFQRFLQDKFKKLEEQGIEPDVW